MVEYKCTMAELAGLPDDSAGSSFTLLPKGDYTAYLEKAEEKTSKKGNKYVSCTYQIMEGDYIKRKIFDLLNLYHPEENVIKIARIRVKQMMKATRLDGIGNFQEMYGIPVSLHLGVDKKEENNVVYGVGIIEKTNIPIETLPPHNIPVCEAGEPTPLESDDPGVGDPLDSAIPF